MGNIKNKTVGSKQKQNQKRKIPQKSDQKRRDTIKQLVYHAPKLMKKASYKKINKNKITKQRINELISEGERDVKRFQSKTIRDAIKHIYQTPLRLLCKFGEEQFKKTKKNLRRNLR